MELLPPLLLLLLLTAIFIDYGLCRDLRQDRSSCRMTPSEWTSTIALSSNISISCNRECTIAAVDENRTKRKKTVRGTRVYSLDSDLCLAAIHDARLAYPSRWETDTALVQLSVVRHRGQFFGSFRRGIVTPTPRKKNDMVRKGLTFVSDKVNEPVPQMTVVYTNFRFSEPTARTAVECHVPVGQTLSEVKLLRSTGIEYPDQETTTQVNGSRGNFKSVHSGKRTVCFLDGTVYSDTTAFGYYQSPYFTPRRQVHRASLGDRIEIGIEHTDLKEDVTWEKDGRSLDTPPSRKFVIESAEPSDAGLYELTLKGGKSGVSFTSVIIRDCPAGHYGPRCGLRCPYCLHGGQCHDATGQCICPPGFHGDRCETSCEKGRFGANCSSSCSEESGGECKGQLLCVPEPYGCSCPSGFGGSFCNTPCSRGLYGPDCKARCGRCGRSSTCDRFTGQCEGGCQDGYDPPLCLDLPPWFRDPPVLDFVGFTTLRFTHALWRDGYDNGYGSGRYSYLIEYRRNDSGQEWTAGQTRRGDKRTGKVMFELESLTVDTTYLVRIVIQDERQIRIETNDTRVPTIIATTNCQEPDEITRLEQRSDPSQGLYSVDIEDIRNEDEACPYVLSWTLNRTATPQKTDMVNSEQPNKVGITTVFLGSLLPYTDYAFEVHAENRKGRSGPASISFRTREAPPSAVRSLSVKNSGVSEYIIKWEPPEHPNGRIRGYLVVLEHLQYLACKGRSIQHVTEASKNESSKFAMISVKHPYSAYTVTVTAVTISSGPSTPKKFTTEAQAPSAGLSNARANVVNETEAELAWELSDCTTWNDDFSNIRVSLRVQGTSLWNKNKSYNDFETKRPDSIQAVKLTPYSTYTAILNMNNSVGFSPMAREIPFTTKQRSKGPAQPSSLTLLTVSSTSLTVGWNPPSPPLCRITTYKVGCQEAECPRTPTEYAVDQCCPADSTLGRRCSAIVADLKEVTSYTLSVSAYCVDVQKEGSPSKVKGKTEEGRPGPPVNVRLEGRSLTELNVSWSSPVQRNGVILHYQINISEPTEYSDFGLHEPHFIDVDPKANRYYKLVTGLEPGQRYLVRVAASTSAGQGNISEVWLETQVPPPQLPAAPEVRHDLVTDTTVQVNLPAVSSVDGPPVSQYFVIVSEDLELDDRKVTELHQSSGLPNADEASRDGISFYVAAVLDPKHVDTNGTIVIGDGKYYSTPEKSYHNRPLKTGQTYLIGMAALSKLSEDNLGLGFKAIKDPITIRAPTAIGTILGILFSVMLLSLLAVALVVCRRRLMTQKARTNLSDRIATSSNVLPLHRIGRSPRDLNLPRQDVPEEGEEATYANLTPLFLNQSRIPLPELAATARNVDLLRSQITSLQSGLIRPCNYARLMQNRGKNRYGNLMPYDDSRVKLKKLDNDDFSDYINASYVDGYERTGAYIATQGPKPETIFDFWRMLWEKKAVRIVMLTNLVEGDKKKCDLYWPEDKPLQLLGLTVQKESERVSNDYTIRTFSMVKNAERRTVTHLHYTVWPDHSVPLYPSSLARFIRELDSMPDGDGPTVVHCSAGVGRTGTVILIDAMHKMGRREQAVDVYRQLTLIREQRANLCANLSQYQLVHQVLVELLISPSTAVPAARLASRLPQLKSVADGPSELEQQLSYLASNPPTASFASARAEQLEGKNRCPEILPEDKSRVFLHGNMRDNYVNAVYVQGFKKPDAFIATEAPLPARRNIFWQMVVQKQSQTIVVMNDLAPDDVFWPTTEEPMIYGSIAAQLKGKMFEPVETLDITLNVFTNGQMKSSQDVRLFLLPFDPASERLPSAGDMVGLHAAYGRSMPDSYGGVTTVVCRTGVTGCGLFIACSFVMDQLAEEQEIDVVMAVSTLRKSRPQFIGTLKQFELCYDVALAWLEAFGTYSNFQ